MTSASWSIEPIDRQRHDRSRFDCGVSVLNDWLATKASQYQKKDLSRTYVAVKAGEAVVRGYYALSTHAVVFDALPDDQAKGLPRHDIPVLLIGRLAVDRSVQGQGLGEFLLMDALSRAESLAKTIGIRAVEVDAIDDSAKRFYQRYGFIELLDDQRHLFLPIATVRKLKFGGT